MGRLEAGSCCRLRSEMMRVLLGWGRAESEGKGELRDIYEEFELKLAVRVLLVASMKKC